MPTLSWIGLSVFRGSVEKKSFKIKPSTYRSYPKKRAYAVSTTNAPFRKPLKLEKILAIFFGRTIMIVHTVSADFLAKVTMKEVWTEGHQQSETAGRRRGLKERHRLHGDAKKHVSARHAYGESRTKFLNGVICGLSDRSGSKKAERSHRIEATKLSGAC